jgi:ATP-dependent RNA helicase DDX42
MGVFDESSDDDDSVAEDPGRRVVAPGGVAAAVTASWPINSAQEEQEQQLLPGKPNGEKEEEGEEEDPLDAYMKSLEQQQPPAPSSSPTTTASALHKQQRFDLENDDHDHDCRDDHDYSDGDDTFSKKKNKSAPAAQNHSCPGDSKETQKQQSAYATSLTTSTTWQRQKALSSFWTPHDTEPGRAWRATHDVTCSGATMDPIFHFSNLVQQQQQQQHEQHEKQNKDDVDKEEHDDEQEKYHFLFLANNNHIINAALIDATLYQLGFQQPTIVQCQTLPVVLSGRNVLVTAATGQGKTLAYAWPVMIHVLHQQQQQQEQQQQQQQQQSPLLQINKEESSSSSSSTLPGPWALILVPTRELALQVNKQVELLFKAAASVTRTTTPLTTRAVIGGVGKYILHQQIKKSGGAVHVVVATPGRLLDVLSSDNTNTSSNNNNKRGLTVQRVSMLVLDEMDKMLSMGFETQVRQILSYLPKQQHQQHQRQTLMFSATLGGRRVEKLAKEWLAPSYVRIAVGQVGECSTSVQQHVIVLPHEQAKQSFILSMLPTLQDVGRTLIFCATRQGCEQLAHAILQNNNNNHDNITNNDNGSRAHNEREQGVKLEIIHGERHQSDRVKALKNFTQGRVKVLIATDVAGRGLDVPNVATVINFDPAKNMDSHVHRIGRAGRISKQHQQKKKKKSSYNSNDDADGDHGDDPATIQQHQPQEGTAYTLLTPKNEDFAHALRNVLRRQGRPISQELNDLANKSRKVGEPRGSNDSSHRRSSNHSRESAVATAHYAPSPESTAPPQKRSRWV